MPLTAGASRGRRHARRPAAHQLRQRRDVGRRRSAAAADEVDPALVDEALQLEGQARRRLAVLAALVGQAGVRVHAHEAGRERRERAQVVGHELGPGGAVEPDREEVEVLERRRRAPRRPGRRASCPSARSSPLTMSGSSTPASRMAARTPSAAALTFSVSWPVSSSSASTPPAMSAGRLQRVAVAHLVEGHVAGDA